MSRKLRTLLIIGIMIAALAAVFFAMGGRDRMELISLNRTMETEDRIRKLKVGQVVKTLDIRPGQCVADIGAGTGLFTWPMARAAAPGGIVYAVDINPLLLKNLDDKAAKLAPGNVRTVQAAEADPLIPERVDLIFSCGTIHYIEDQVAYFRKLRDYLKPGGRIAVIDLEKSHAYGHLISYTPEEQEAWMKSAGFARTQKYDFLEDFYFVVYALAR